MNTQANLIIIMGVSGCGKSAVAKAVAHELSYEYVEGDDFHPEENKAHMASGKALNDSMREPWIALLQGHLKQCARANRSAVMSFSGLRREHRAKMRDLPLNSLFIHLQGEQELINQRINDRDGHFMPSSLLDSQFAALQTANKKEVLHAVDINQDLGQVISSAIAISKQELEQ
jgi:gluconokinase